MIEQIALSRGHEIVCTIDVDNREDFSTEAFRSADVAIEFTTPTAAYDNYVRAFQEGAKVDSLIKEIRSSGRQTFPWGWRSLVQSIAIWPR